MYPSNIGHSKKKFTTAHRSILWLVKDNPKIYMDRVTQPYKNPTDKRVKKLIESGRKGTHLYNWWEINLVKNVSKDKKHYVNQIPNEVLKRLPELPQIMDKANEALSLLAEGKINQSSSSYHSLQKERLKIKSYKNNFIIAFLVLIILILLVF